MVTKYPDIQGTRLVLLLYRDMDIMPSLHTDLYILDGRALI